ncbi:TadE family protein [Paramaledivibacter caminithermalis]|jgi:hypothetical protein|uniref:TadE-like protein n=1 Tax=Paramaledivibacter caminithermalis (strain DSM 15212 / CIP 107654 / DViRD3) TaxID=1121301 RepID=A0A1M6PHU5_PARC5|nr:TadE family protein [Paramaledivibacter caminithermalis]SHK07521.1 TadE-like protein [Paramaledivibacter caminithermalis DSM 15212]
MKRAYWRVISNKGSLTVEASLIFPIIFLAILVVIHICILLYQYAHLQSTANHVAERGAACWNNVSRMEIDTYEFRLKTGKLKESKELLKEGLYMSYKKEKIKKMKIYLLNKLKQNNILEGEISKIDTNDIINSKDKIDIWIKDYIVYKELNIKIKDSYKIPLGDSLKIFGINDKYNINVYSKAVINEPVDFIRNIDFIGDTLNEHEFTSKYINKFKETMGKIKNNIERFFQD